jgi:hypothetical protein
MTEASVVRNFCYGYFFGRPVVSPILSICCKKDEVVSDATLNSITNEEDAKHVFLTLNNTNGMTTVNLSKAIENSSTLQTLDLKLFHPKAMGHLSRALQNNTSITSLNLSMPALPVDELKYLLHSLKSKPTLNNLILDSVPALYSHPLVSDLFKSLPALTGFQIKGDLMRDLRSFYAESLFHNPEILITVELADFSSYFAVKEIFAGLSRCTNLETLKLDNNGFRDEDCLLLADTVLQKCPLLNLSLAHNSIEPTQEVVEKLFSTPVFLNTLENWDAPCSAWIISPSQQTIYQLTELHRHQSIMKRQTLSELLFKLYITPVLKREIMESSSQPSNKRRRND